MVKKLVRGLKTVLQQERRDLREWVDLVSAIQWFLNTASRQRYASTPYHVLFSSATRISFSTITSASGKDRQIDVLNDEGGKRKVIDVVAVQQEMHKQVQDMVKQNRDKQRRHASRGELPNLAVGVFALRAWVRKPTSSS